MAVPVCRPCISPMPFSIRLSTTFYWSIGTAAEPASPNPRPRTRLIPPSQEVADAAALINVLTQRYGQRRVIVVGHSYGSYLGIALSAQHPELVRAYVG